MIAAFQLLIGILFGAGLTLSGMTDTENIRGFLAPLSGWNPQLLVVMASALTVAIPGFLITQRRQCPLLDGQFPSNTAPVINKQLIVGATLFGLGWGLYGLCPGPAITSIIYGSSDTIIFILAMVFGMFVSVQTIIKTS
ncbi:MAG: YeeE/YedE family protein [Cellvibrionales bacterium]|nr:YeeE/YedE family protein [Cellvibrionales bacterium]